MFYKGIILDLDNTIYSYDECHNQALDKVLAFLNENYDCKKSKEEIKNIYDNISKKLKYELINTASSHNKSIYFKQLLEYLNINISILSILNNIYWNTFLDNIKCFEGVKDFLIWNKKIGIKIGILSDYETEYQIEKLNKLDIINCIDIVITSEEVGIEKPSIQMFQTILRKVNLNTDEVIMIGDDFQKDILGAINIGIFSYWFNNKNIINNNNDKLNYIEFNSFKTLYEDFDKIHNELIKFKNISRFCGERFDLVQAGGGNSSVKFGDYMFIKASGVNMSNVNINNGYVVIDNKKILNDINSNIIKEVTEYNLFGQKRASIETFMHSILKKYTLHIHPIQINRILITTEAKNIIKEIFPDSLIIDYFTPGIKICNKIRKVYNNENLIFLINHGIIITSDTYEDLYNILEKVIIEFEKKQQINYEKYKFTNKLSCYINKYFKTDNISYLCDNSKIIFYLQNKKYLFDEKISFPDALVYCGLKILFINNFNEINEYNQKYNEIPKIIVVNNNIYINTISLQKCKEIEDVLLSNLLILDSEFTKNYLPYEEICFLNNWDAEKYRKIL
jgi:FMN phosphatase YigB (HAD superfamily)/rhamnose utilization protein RhaD (predicted bifunctional aldolase and dehydrogenase)